VLVYNTLPVGAHTINAVFSGNGGYTGSSGSVTPVLVTAPGTTTTTVSANPTSSVFSQPVTFTATVSPNAPSTALPNGGTVTFYDGPGTANPIGSAAVSNGTAQIVRALSVGSHSIHADFSGT